MTSENVLHDILEYALDEKLALEEELGSEASYSMIAEHTVENHPGIFETLVISLLKERSY